MKQRYPFTEWKAINWDEKLIATRPLIANAQRLNDTVLFTEALFEYLNGIPDGHIKMHGIIKRVLKTEVIL